MFSWTSLLRNEVYDEVFLEILCVHQSSRDLCIGIQGDDGTGRGARRYSSVYGSPLFGLGYAFSYRLGLGPLFPDFKGGGGYLRIVWVTIYGHLHGHAIKRQVGQGLFEDNMGDYLWSSSWSCYQETSGAELFEDNMGEYLWSSS
ncbi:hypothetical protein VNO78_30604 [Psophocarpus tetragonolobus]|uniref:Uncharacterized protein n=1 Tax=Psophocarpus tetragonolobus TaxID=3891 RepID=A0AAN9X6Z5_PSOTE